MCRGGLRVAVHVGFENEQNPFCDEWLTFCFCCLAQGEISANGPLRQHACCKPCCKIYHHRIAPDANDRIRGRSAAVVLAYEKIGGER